MAKKQYTVKNTINVRERLNTTNLTEITSVGSFLDEIKKIGEREEENPVKIFFRGQKVEYWDISSSLFRLGMLKSEHKLLKEPLEKFPNEFKSLKNTFDLMTKCQHYGLCTRLLDLTTNPLVALYFACQSNGKEKYKKDPEMETESSEIYEELEPWGIVYYKKTYPLYSDNENVRIITELAKYDLEQENTLDKVLLNLKEANIITDKEYTEWNKNFDVFIKIIQENYVVQPTNNNNRLTAQSGAFLLPSMFSFDENQRLITKSQRSLKNEFEKEFFYVKGDKKEEILEELNICNINESTLFPELEHQLNHIKTINRVSSSFANDFIKYEKNNTDKQNNKLTIIQEKDINPNFDKELKTFLQTYITNKAQSKKLYDLIKENSVIDWYKRDSTLNKIKFGINKYLKSSSKSTIPEEDLNQEIDKILNYIINLYIKK